ncbi:MAG: DNA helicase, partial [Acidiphilium sp. 37-67-22]
FCNRKRDVDILCKSLVRHQFSAGMLHGDMPQSARFATLEKFKAGEIRLLVCSDVAARGIDIGGLSHVFNFDVPHHAEDYVHRIGRTGRAGLQGRALTLAGPEDRIAVEAIERLTGHEIPRLAVDGLDPVEWEESDGRGRRGRGKGRGAAKPAAAPTAAAEPASPKAATTARSGERRRPERSERPDRAERSERPDRPERGGPRPREEGADQDKHNEDTEIAA